MSHRSYLGIVVCVLIGCASLVSVSACCKSTPGASSKVAPQVAGPYLTAPTETTVPPVTNPIPKTTPVIYVAWVHPTVPANEQITLSLIAVNVGTAAPPNTVVLSTHLPAAQAGPNHGTGNFSKPTAGWPTGEYRVTATGNTLGQFAVLDFGIH